MRFPDWEDRLNAVLDEFAYAPHVYGSHDCGLFTAAAVAAQTGDDFGANLRGRYTSRVGAARALVRYGSGTLAATITAALGQPGPLAWAHRGDVCWFNDTPGILQATHGIFVGGADEDRELYGVGLMRVPRHLLDRDCAWPVPFA